MVFIESHTSYAQTMRLLRLEWQLAEAFSLKCSQVPYFLKVSREECLFFLLCSLYISVMINTKLPSSIKAWHLSRYEPTFGVPPSDFHLMVQTKLRTSLMFPFLWAWHQINSHLSLGLASQQWWLLSSLNLTHMYTLTSFTQMYILTLTFLLLCVWKILSTFVAVPISLVFL